MNKYQIQNLINIKLLESHRGLDDTFTALSEFIEDESPETLEVIMAKLNKNDIYSEDLKKEILKLIKIISEE